MNNGILVQVKDGKYLTILTTDLATLNPVKFNVRLCAPGTEFRISRHVSVTQCFQRRSQQHTVRHRMKSVSGSKKTLVLQSKKLISLSHYFSDPQTTLYIIEPRKRADHKIFLNYPHHTVLLMKYFFNLSEVF